MLSLEEYLRNLLAANEPLWVEIEPANPFVLHSSESITHLKDTPVAFLPGGDERDE